MLGFILLMAIVGHCAIYGIKAVAVKRDMKRNEKERQRLIKEHRDKE